MSVHVPASPHFGKLPVDPAKPVLRFADHLKVTPQAPIADVAPHLNYPMDENDQWGDCVVAGLDHALQVICAALGVPRTNWTETQIVAYYRTQNPTFDPNSTSNGPGSNADGGMSVQDFLAYLVKQGVILGFALVDHANEAEMKAATWLGLAVPTGEELTTKNLSERVWDYHPGDRIEGGHCTDNVGYEGTPDTDDLVSWGDLYGMTEAFLAHRVDEAYFIVTQAHVDHPAFRAGFDLASFAAAYTDLTGRPFPVSVTPAPGPAPTPVPDQVDASLYANLLPWAQARHTGSNKRAAQTFLDWAKAKGYTS